MNVESKRCRVLGGKVSISIIGGMFLCVGILISFTAMIGIIKAIPGAFPSAIVVFIGGGLGGGFGYITLTRIPYETAWNDEGINMLFLRISEIITWDQVAWYKVAPLIGSAGVNLWIVLKYRESLKEKTCYRTSVMLFQILAPFEGFSSKCYTSIFDKYIPHKRIEKWRQVFQHGKGQA